MKKEIFLNTTAIDHKFNFNSKQKKFYLGRFCISDKLNLNEFDNSNCIRSIWSSRKNNIKEYLFLKKISITLLKFLISKLNKIHNKNEDYKYWKIILYPWICYYVNTTYDRWKIISFFIKSQKKRKFLCYEYNLPESFLKIKDLLHWYYKISSDTLNNYLFCEIIKYRKVRNIRVERKKINKIFVKQESNKSQNFSLVRILDKILSFLNSKFSKVYVDKFYFPKKSFLKICLRNFQIPAKNLSSFEKFYSQNNFNETARKYISEDKKFGSQFEKFLYKKLYDFLPMSYLENYTKILSQNKKKIRKRIFIGMYSVHWNDQFKVYLAESIKNGSKYFHSNHGSGVEGKYDTFHDHFDEISEKTIVQNKKTILKNQIFLGSTLFSLKKRKSNPKKLLINFHEPERYFLRFPISTTHLDGHIKSFMKLQQSCKKLKRDIFENLRYRSKHNVGFNSELRFLKSFGKSKIEKISSIKYTNSILDSKLVICHVPQTSYTECLFQNIPTILIVDDLKIKKIQTSFFDTKEKKVILKKFLRSNMAFTSHDLAVRFVNKNWENISKWWNSKKVQSARTAYLNNFFAADKNFEENWSRFINQNLKLI